MNLEVKEIDCIITALMDYIDKLMEKDDGWIEIAMMVLGLVKKFKDLRRTKLNES